MNLKIRDDSTNYTCSVIKLPVMQAIPGLDNLVQVDVFGNQCLIGKNSDPTVMYLYFPAGCQLSQPFLSANGLYREQQLNKDINQKGFFEPNGRVKGLKLKGIVSTGFVIPMTSLELTLPYSEGGDASGLAVGDEFNEWCGIEICRKYIPKGTHIPGVKGDKQQKVNSKLADLLIPTQFRFHGETTHLGKNIHNINPNDIIVCTDKWHGSSCILGLVYVNNKLNKAQKLWNKVGWLPKFNARKLAYIASSGKPKSNLPKLIEGVWENKGVDYYTTNIWKEALDTYRTALEEGISLYGEIVGYTSGGAAIQKGYDYKCKPAPGVKFGEDGLCLCDCATPCPNGKCGSAPRCTKDEVKINRFVIYKITYTKPNGEFIVFSRQQVKDYCQKYGLEYVKEFYHGRAADLFPEICPCLPPPTERTEEEWMEVWRDLFFNKLQKSFNLEEKCNECRNDVPAEGIVIWKDGQLTRYEVYKLKSKLFTLKESNEEEVNMEDQQ